MEAHGCGFVDGSVTAILEGLLEEHKTFVVSVTSESEPYTMDEIEALLLAQEERIENFKKDTTLPMSAKIAQFQKGNK